jgi:hypothetical protein
MSMNMKSKMTKLGAWSLSLCLLLANAGFTTAGSAGAVAGLPAEGDNVTPEEGARQFDAAVRDIEGILGLDLTTVKGVKQSSDIIERSHKKLALVEKKAFHAALRVSAFQKGIKDAAAKRKGGAEELARELEANPEAVANIPGAEEAARAIRESTRPAAETLKRVGEALKRASDAAKSKDSRGALRGGVALKAGYIEPEVVGEVAATAAYAQGTSFCGPYKYICDLLARLGLYALRASVAALNAASRKAGCVVDAYRRWQTCVATASPWQILYCNSQFNFSVSACLLFA